MHRITPSRHIARCLVLALVACCWSTNLAFAHDPAETSEAVNRFADDLYDGLNDKDNQLFSPASLATAMGMAYAGAQGDTASQIAEVLHVSASPDEIHELFGGLTTMQPMPGTPTFGARCQANKGYGLLVTEVIPATAADRAGLKVNDLVLAVNGEAVRTEADWAGQIDRADNQLDIRWYSFENGTVMERKVSLSLDFLNVTNAVWAQKGYPLNSQYVEKIKKGFSGVVSSLDFKKDTAGAVKIINRWISKQTSGKITDLLSTQSVSGDVRLVLTNTVNFKGVWQKPFPKSDDKINWVSNSKSRKVPGMKTTEDFHFIENDLFQALEMHYSDGPLAMVMVLPRENQEWSDFRDAFTLSDVGKLRKDMKPMRVHVELPKFSFPAQVSLRDQLESKMPLAFSEQANFTGISRTGEIQLHDIVHKAFIAVDENGTEASAASAVVVGIKRAPDANFLATRPFLFLLVDRNTNAIWFAGQLTKP